MRKTTETKTSGWGKGRTITTVTGTITAAEPIETGYMTGTYAVTLDDEATYSVVDLGGLVAARIGIEITGTEGVTDVHGMTRLTIKTDLATTY